MAAPEQAPSGVPAFSVVRRGYDPDQVAKHLNRLDAEATILAADRAAAVEQATQLGRQLGSCRTDLDAARVEIERLRSELRVLSGPPDTVSSMNERLQVMLRLAKDEFSGMHATLAAQAAAHAADVIAAVGAEAGDITGFGFDESELRGPRDESELEQLRRSAAAERARLDEAAAAKRATEDEEFRQVLALRCREAMAQLAKLQTEAMRSARRVLDDAEEQARTLLADAREAVRRTVDDAQREVDDLHALRQRLASQLDTSRQLLDRAMPEERAAQAAAAAAVLRNGTGAGSTNGGAPRSVAAVIPVEAPAGPVAAPQPDPPTPASPTTTAEPSTSSAAPSTPPTSAATPAATTAATTEAMTGATPDHRPEPSSEQQAAPTAIAGLLPPPTLPALAGLPVPAGWPVAPAPPANDGSPGAHPAAPAEPQPQAVRDGWPTPQSAPDPGKALEQTQPGLPEYVRAVREGNGSYDTNRAQPVRIPPRDQHTADVPVPSRIPLEEQDPQVAPPRRYP